MLPISLSITLHQQKTPRLKLQPDRLGELVRLVLQNECSLFAKAKRCCLWLFPKLRLVIAMESHTISMVAVVVEQYAVKGCSGYTFNSAFDIK